MKPLLIGLGTSVILMFGLADAAEPDLARSDVENAIARTQTDESRCAYMRNAEIEHPAFPAFDLAAPTSEVTDSRSAPGDIPQVRRVPDPRPSLSGCHWLNSGEGFIVTYP